MIQVQYIREAGVITETQMRIEPIGAGFGNYIYTYYDGKLDVFENDIKNFIGVVQGNHTYESQAGYKITLPLVVLKKVE